MQVAMRGQVAQQGIVAMETWGDYVKCMAFSTHSKFHVKWPEDWPRYDHASCLAASLLILIGCNGQMVLKIWNPSSISCEAWSEDHLLQLWWNTMCGLWKCCKPFNKIQHGWHVLALGPTMLLPDIRHLVLRHINTSTPPGSTPVVAKFCEPPQNGFQCPIWQKIQFGRNGHQRPWIPWQIRLPRVPTGPSHHI